MEVTSGIDIRREPDWGDKGETQEYLIFLNSELLYELRSDTTDEEIAARCTAALRVSKGKGFWKGFQAKLNWDQTSANWGW